MTLKELKKGTYFTLKDIEEPKPKQVWVKEDYDKKSKTYSCRNFEDRNHERFFKENKEIYNDFFF